MKIAGDVANVLEPVEAARPPGITGEGGHLVLPLKQQWHDVLADEPGCTGDKYLH